MKFGTKNIKILARNEELYIKLLNGTIKTFNIPEGVNEIKEQLFQNCTSLTSITIPNSLTKIGISAFRNCTSLTSITIPNSVTDIWANSFQNCTSLKSVTLSNSLTSLNNNLFQNCTALTSITIPKSVTKIDATAFGGCTNLTSITVQDKSEGEISGAPWGATNATVTWTGGVKLIINTTPADAIVTFSTGKISGNQTIVKKGTVVTYTVSKDGYYSVSGTVTLNSDQTINVSLEQIYYNDGQTLWESGSGGAAATLNLLTSGRYRVICIGGGGGAAERYIKAMFTKHWSATGGSGSGFDCVFMLTKGNYSVNVGNGGSGNLSTNAPGKVSDGGNSSFGDSYAYGGGGGNCSAGPALTAGAAGAAPTLTYAVVSSALNRAGNSGQTSTSNINISGGASIYGSYGKGGDCQNNAAVINGNAGYVKVIFLGK